MHQVMHTDFVSTQSTVNYTNGTEKLLNCVIQKWIKEIDICYCNCRILDALANQKTQRDKKQLMRKQQVEIKEKIDLRHF